MCWLIIEYPNIDDDQPLNDRIYLIFLNYHKKKFLIHCIFYLLINWNV